MNGLLVRVGIDSTYGKWNGPVDPFTGEFVYVSIPEDHSRILQGHDRPYKDLIPFLSQMNAQLPLHLHDKNMHLDPDFLELTYGDCHPRSLPIKSLSKGDFLVFYSGLQSINPECPGLHYALIGFYVIGEVVPAADIPSSRWYENAHTRRSGCAGDTVVRAISKESGRLVRCLKIGEFRDRAYRVLPDLLDAWGGLSVRDGYIHRSATLPSFKDPASFLKWFRSQKPELIQRNN